MKIKISHLLLAIMPVIFACTLASAQDMAKVDTTAPKAPGKLHKVNLARAGSGSKLAKTATASRLPVDNDHDPRFQKLKIHDPNYTAAMSFE